MDGCLAVDVVREALTTKHDLCHPENPVDIERCGNRDGGELDNIFRTRQECRPRAGLRRSWGRPRFADFCREATSIPATAGGYRQLIGYAGIALAGVRGVRVTLAFGPRSPDVVRRRARPASAPLLCWRGGGDRGGATPPSRGFPAVAQARTGRRGSCAWPGTGLPRARPGVVFRRSPTQATSQGLEQYSERKDSASRQRGGSDAAISHRLHPACRNVCPPTFDLAPVARWRQAETGTEELVSETAAAASVLAARADQLPLRATIARCRGSLGAVTGAWKPACSRPRATSKV